MGLVDGVLLMEGEEEEEEEEEESGESCHAFFMSSVLADVGEGWFN